MSNSLYNNGVLPKTVNNVIENLPTTRTDTRFPLKDIDSIQFGISSPEEIMKKGVCKIDSHKLSGPGSVYDPRMGAMENNETCVTCGKNSLSCAGHSGWIELNNFILHPMFLRYITNFLKCLCIKCYRVVLTQDHLNLDGVLKYHQDSRFEKIVDRLEKVDICYHCGSPKPKFVFQLKTFEITMCFDKKKVVISDTEIKKIFDNIPNEDVELLGFNPNFMHPKNLVLSVLEVIPPRARPYIIADNVACDDDLTISLAEVVKANNILGDETANASKKDKALQTLKFRIKTMMNNSQGRARHSNGRPLKCIKARLSGKEGLIRKNLMGKRRNQSARTVISADPSIRSDELAIPPEFAKNLTMPVLVSKLNIDHVQRIVDEGKANFVIKPNKTTRINLKYAMNKKGTPILWGDKIERGNALINPHAEFGKRDFELREGDIILRNGARITEIEVAKKKPYKIEIGDSVERQMTDGDLVLFNRQPSLHNGSMIAKKILIKPGRTFRFSLAATKSFNADFDGDEIDICL